MKQNVIKWMSLLLFVMATQVVMGQKVPKADKSPADISYYKTGGETVAKVVYGRPQMNDREIFGKLVKFDKVWRTGANEATEIRFYQDVTLAGEAVAAGTYTLFTIPGESEWKIILNSELDQWGAYRHDKKKDVLTVSVPAGTSEEAIESMAIFFDKDSMYIGWGNTLVAVPVGVE
ncbi:MAG: DUF2911 domain-containing protein [Bacteroidia bacterium]